MINSFCLIFLICIQSTYFLHYSIAPVDVALLCCIILYLSNSIRFEAFALTSDEFTFGFVFIIVYNYMKPGIQSTLSMCSYKLIYDLNR